MNELPVNTTRYTASVFIGKCSAGFEITTTFITFTAQVFMKPITTRDVFDKELYII